MSLLICVGDAVDLLTILTFLKLVDTQIPWRRVEYLLEFHWCINLSILPLIGKGIAFKHSSCIATDMATNFCCNVQFHVVCQCCVHSSSYLECEDTIIADIKLKHFNITNDLKIRLLNLFRGQILFLLFLLITIYIYTGFNSLYIQSQYMKMFTNLKERFKSRTRVTWTHTID